MFVVLLRFSDNKDQAAQYLARHNAWIQQGFDDGVFLVVGSLQPKLGGALIANNTSLSNLRSRVSNDPFVEQKVVDAEIFEIEPGQTDGRLQFLLG